MLRRRAQSGRPVGRASASWLALPCALACGNSASSTWVATQECTVGIPPEQAPPAAIPPVTLPLAAQISYTGNGFSLRNFTIGPIAGFSCEAVPFEVIARYTDRDLTQTPEHRPVLARAIALDPFDCRAADGRHYMLTGTGQADQRFAFINMTFSAWLAAGEATLHCTTRIGLAPPDAGVEALPEPPPVAPGEGDAPPPIDDGTPGVPPDPGQ